MKTVFQIVSVKESAFIFVNVTNFLNFVIKNVYVIEKTVEIKSEIF